jgi:hypothetical protein
MSDRKRLHREDPARVAPVRNFSNLYRQNESANGRVKPAKTAAPDEAGNGAGRGPLAEGVELAYRVIEKYVSEGRRTAEGFSNQAYTTRAATDNLQNILERMLRFQTEILPLWVETLSTLVRVDPSETAHAPADGRPLTGGASNGAADGVSIEVVSRRPIKVSVDLRPNSEMKSLVALGLGAVDSKKPALKDVRFVPDETPGRIKLRIRVPDKQPPGTYSGVIVNRNNGEARGTLSVRIAD